MHKQTGQECITGHCKLEAIFPKAITSLPLPQEPVLSEETSFLYTAIGTGLLLNATLLMIWDIR